MRPSFSGIVTHVISSPRTKRLITKEDWLHMKAALAVAKDNVAQILRTLPERKKPSVPASKQDTHPSHKAREGKEETAEKESKEPQEPQEHTDKKDDNVGKAEQEAKSIPTAVKAAGEKEAKADKAVATQQKDEQKAETQKKA